jgi:hypothetical protein
VVDREAWSEELRPILARAATGALAYRVVTAWIDGVESGRAVLAVARSAGRPVGVILLAFQHWPLPEVHVVAMATASRTGFAWGAALMPHVRRIAAAAGAVHVRAVAETEANYRRLRRMGFAQIGYEMAAPV